MQMSENNTNVVVETETVSDAEASQTLKVLFSRYQKLKKSRPKLPGEAVMTPAVWEGSFDIEAIMADVEADMRTWSEKLYDVMQGIHAVGDENPGASIRLINARTGKGATVNGARLLSALLREDTTILSSKLAA
jgi:hypothetical protein